MRNQLIPTEELEMLVSEMNDRLDALEIRVAEVIKRERIILLNEKQKEIENVQKQIIRREHRFWRRIKIIVIC